MLLSTQFIDKSQIKYWRGTLSLSAYDRRVLKYYGRQTINLVFHLYLQHYSKVDLSLYYFSEIVMFRYFLIHLS